MKTLEDYKEIINTGLAWEFIQWAESNGLNPRDNEVFMKWVSTFK